MDRESEGWRGGRDGGKTDRTGGSPRETKLRGRSPYVVLLARPDAAEEMFKGSVEADVRVSSLFNIHVGSPSVCTIMLTKIIITGDV